MSLLTSYSFPKTVLAQDGWPRNRGSIPAQSKIFPPAVQDILSSRLLSKNVKIRMYKTAIWPVVLYGCGTWSLTLREEHRLRMFEIRVLARIFEPKRDEMTGG
jgi:hypothetical protein